jgi:hypothetical protein
MNDLFKNAPEDLEKRLKFIERIISRLARRANKKATATITPYPISNAVFGVAINGVILRYMFPCSGKITKAFLRLGEKPKTSISLQVRVFNNYRSIEKSFIVSKMILSENMTFDILHGDCLEVSLVNNNTNNAITESWISLLWEPSVSDIVAKSFLINDLEESMKNASEIEEATTTNGNSRASS